MDDPLWGMAVLAMHFDGAEGSTAAVDIKGAAFTAYGNAHITTADSAFAGGSCAIFDGAGDYFRTGTLPGGWMGSEPFSISFWVRTTAVSKVMLDFDYPYAGGLYQVRLTATGCVDVYSYSGVWFAGTIPVNDDAWHRVVIGRINGFGAAGNKFRDGYITVDGVLDVYASLSPTSFFASTEVKITIGAQVTSRDASKDFVGKLDDLVIHIGSGYLLDAFAVPSAPFGEAFLLSPAVLVSPPSAALLADPVPPVSAIRLIGGALLADMDNGGNGRIVGTTKNVGTPDYPVSRRVRLLRKRDGQMVRETWSDAAGNYAFDHIRRDIEYVVLGHDHTGVYNAEVADSLLPDPMP